MARSSGSRGGGGRGSSGGSRGSSSRSSSGGHRSGSSRSSGGGFSFGSSRGRSSRSSNLGSFAAGVGVGSMMSGSRRGYRPRRRGYGFFGRSYRAPRARRYGCISGGIGCLTAISLIIIIIFIVAVFSDSSGSVPPSTRERAALTNIAPGDILTYRDGTRAGDWFFDARKMEDGANEAHRLTGVKFGIYVTEGRYTPSELEDMADGFYGDWFGDSSGHLMLVLTDEGDGTYAAYDMIGAQARTVFDNEAMDILYGYLDMYWEQPGQYSESEMFGLTLQNTAERIMSVTPTFGQTAGRYIGIAVIILAAGVTVMLVLRSIAKKKEAEAEQTRADAELLNTPVAGLDTAASDPLLSQYLRKDNDPDNP